MQSYQHEEDSPLLDDAPATVERSQVKSALLLACGGAFLIIGSLGSVIYLRKVDDISGVSNMIAGAFDKNAHMAIENGAKKTHSPLRKAPAPAEHPLSHTKGSAKTQTKYADEGNPAVNLGVYGGGGGSYSDFTAPYHANVLKIIGRSGDIVDGIGCTFVSAVTGAEENCPYRGGGGGGYQERYCGSGFTAAWVTYRDLVGSIGLKCDNNWIQDIGAQGWDNARGQGKELTCPNAMIISGYQARAGSLLDAYGINCRYRVVRSLPTPSPISSPTVLPTFSPSALPTFVPTLAPTALSTLSPTMPTNSPTVPPSLAPTKQTLFKDLKLVGGEGGDYGEFICPDYSNLYKLAVRGGDVVDAVQAECKGVDSAGTNYVSQLSGGYGGGYVGKICQQGISEVLINYGSNLVGSINVKCVGQGSYEGQVGGAAWSNAKGSSYTATCPTGTIVGGYQARSGSLVDAFGIYCRYPVSPAPPTSVPTLAPTFAPTVKPIASPTEAPTEAPTSPPVADPTLAPISSPTAAPISDPTLAPVPYPSFEPVAEPTPTPSEAPIATPTFFPIASPTAEPIASPTEVPISEPTTVPISEPSLAPVADPTLEPSQAPVSTPTEAPTLLPTFEPSLAPVAQPSYPPQAEETLAPNGVDKAEPEPEVPSNPEDGDVGEDVNLTGGSTGGGDNDGEDVTFVRGTLAEDEAPVVNPFCALFTFHAVPDPRATSTLTICTKKGFGEVRVGADTLEEYGIIIDGKSQLSDIVPGLHTKIDIFSSPDFNGGKFGYLVHGEEKKYPALTAIKLNNGELANDNIKSLIFNTLLE